MYESLKEKAAQIRRDTLEEIFEAKSGHPGGSLSAMEMLYYNKLQNLDPQNPQKPDRDRFVLSKGHACPALYAILADKGYFPKEELRTLRRFGSRLQGQPDRKKTPGVDACAGSLGQGLSVAVGMALGAKRLGNGVRVYTLLGDGEMQEGQIWEALLFAAHHKLDNLTVLVDNNGIQLDGTNDEVISMGSIADKLRAFNFETIELADGHDFAQILPALDAPHNGMPKAIVAHTVKGKGVSFMENNAGWHGKAPDEEQTKQALAELGGEF